MAEWHQTDDSTVIMGPARVLLAEHSESSYADSIDDIINFATYAAISPWVDIGHTTGPFEITSGFSVADIESQQFGVVTQGNAQWAHMARTTLAEEREGIRTFMSMGLATENASGERVQNQVSEDFVTLYRIAALYLDNTTERVEGDIIHKAKWSGADSLTAWARGGQKIRPVEWTLFPDDDIPNNPVYNHLKETGDWNLMLTELEEIMMTEDGYQMIWEE